MQMKDVLQRIATRAAELGLSETAVSARSKSRDTIRNWRRAVEKGQNPSARHDTLSNIAQTLCVSEDWLINGKGEPQTIAPAAPAPVQGLAEGATPFTLKPHATEINDPQQALRAIFGPAATTPALYRVSTNLPAFEIAAGDVLLADLARLPSPGEIALARVVDEETASAVTVVCRYLPPFLVTGEMGPQVQTLRVDDPGVTVRHPVVGSIRGIPPD